jgi:hypothetical protein
MQQSRRGCGGDGVQWERVKLIEWAGIIFERRFVRSGRLKLMQAAIVFARMGQHMRTGTAWSEGSTEAMWEDSSGPCRAKATDRTDSPRDPARYNK